MMKNFFFLLTSVLLLPLTCACASGDIAAGKAKTALCAACHGAQGNGIEALPLQPRLAGQHAEYITKQLHDFKSGARKNAIMAPLAAPLSDTDISNIAAYYASLKGTTGTSSPELVTRGEDVYRAGDAATGLPACMACHGPDGAGNPAAKYPAISGQFAEYTTSQLTAFKSQARDNDVNSVMRSIAAKMTNDEVTAVADYIQGLH